MRRKRILLAALVVAAAAYLLLWPVPIEPVAWTPAPDPGRTGVFARNARLAGVRKIAVGPGPEDVAQGPDGWLYTGLKGGDIVRFRPDDAASVETFANTRGRPLGLQFDAGGDLIVADSARGLLRVAPDGEVSVLTDSAAGEPLLFPNDLDVAADGTIWFSDSSRRFRSRDAILDFWECRPTGRLLSFDPGTGETRVRLEGLMFANGVALGPEDAWVLVSETLACRVRRLWLEGPRAGESEAFLEGLPGHPDNLSYDGKGRFWIALAAPRIGLLDRLAPWPILRKVAARVPRLTRSNPLDPYGWVIGVDVEGRVVQDLQDPEGVFGSIASANEYGGRLYFGGIAPSTVGWIEAP